MHLKGKTNGTRQVEHTKCTIYLFFAVKTLCPTAILSFLLSHRTLANNFFFKRTFTDYTKIHIRGTVSTATQYTYINSTLYYVVYVCLCYLMYMRQLRRSRVVQYPLVTQIVWRRHSSVSTKFSSTTLFRHLNYGLNQNKKYLFCT